MYVYVCVGVRVRRLEGWEAGVRWRTVSQLGRALGVWAALEARLPTCVALLIYVPKPVAVSPRGRLLATVLAAAVVNGIAGEDGHGGLRGWRVACACDARGGVTSTLIRALGWGPSRLPQA